MYSLSWKILTCLQLRMAWLCFITDPLRPPPTCARAGSRGSWCRGWTWPWWCPGARRVFSPPDTTCWPSSGQLLRSRGWWSVYNDVDIFVKLRISSRFEINLKSQRITWLFLLTTKIWKPNLCSYDKKSNELDNIQVKLVLEHLSKVHCDSI